MISIPLKPFSQNKARKGRQINTDELKAFKRDFKLMLQCADKPALPDGNLEIHFAWGMYYYAQSDYDNPTKTAQDCIADWLGINDNRFTCGSQRKVKVGKGQEFIRFQIRPHVPEKWDGV